MKKSKKLGSTFGQAIPKQDSKFGDLFYTNLGMYILMYYYIRPLAFARAMQFVHLLKNFNSWFFVVKLGNFFSRKNWKKDPTF